MSTIKLGDCRGIVEAVNEACTCGGNGPGDGYPACEVYHAIKAMEFDEVHAKAVECLPDEGDMCAQDGCPCKGESWPKRDQLHSRHQIKILGDWILQHRPENIGDDGAVGCAIRLLDGHNVHAKPAPAPSADRATLRRIEETYREPCARTMLIAKQTDGVWYVDLMGEAGADGKTLGGAINAALDKLTAERVEPAKGGTTT